jgi:hypothetical protein
MKLKSDNSIEKIVQDGLEIPAIDLTVDYAEIALDSFLDNDAIKEIPIVKTIVGFVRGGLKVREIFFAKKLLTFMKEFHGGSLNAIKKEEFLSRFKQDKKYRESVVEQVMILNERFLEIEKSKILANLFAAHLNGKFDWEWYCDLSVCLDNLHLRGIRLFQEMENKKKPFYDGYNTGSEEEALLSSAGIVFRWGTHLQISAHGQYLYYYGIKGDIDYEFPNPVKKD